MGRVKSAAAALRLGCQRSVEKESNIVNNELVLKKLQPAVKRNYEKMMQLWDEYQKQHPEASPYELISLKDFIRKFAYSIDGEEGVDVPGSETVRKQWNAFTAAWQRKDPEQPIPRGIAASVTQFINGPLAEEMGMPKTKRPRRFATKNVMLNFARQLWAADWVEFKRPATVVDDWGLLLGNAYSSSRIGEYIESSCRSGTGRGLYFKDLTFVVFINEAGAPEFAIQLTRDAKNMTCTPDKRPQHALYEGIAPMPLCFNPMLPFLARLLAYRAFRDYHAIDDLLKIMPPEGEMMVIEWKEELLETPFFRSQANDEIETAGAFSHRLRLLGLRAGYATPPRNHDIRAEGLHLMNQFESEATRMVYAGHTDPNTVPRHYLPRNGADGQAAYHSQERRALVLDLFRGLTIPRNPSLWHCLPAKKQFECENCPDIIDINEALYTRRGKTDSKSLEERKKLYAEKRKLFAKQLRDWQKSQPVKHDDPPGYHRAIFDRIRFLMPERDRLARNIFEVDVLRSSAGLAVLNDMLALYQKSSNVECRPGLELDRCQCGKGNDRPYEWRHVYECYKAAASKVHGFSELCFLCNQWFHGAEGWEQHCRHHLNHPDGLPIWCDPLTYGGVLARAGYCPFCLGDERLPAQVRMRQFKIRWTWLDHIQTHIRRLPDGLVPVRCPRLHSHCPGEFESVLELRFHLQDAFGVELNKDGAGKKRHAQQHDDHPLPKRKRVRRCRSALQEDDIVAFMPTQYVFSNTDVDSMKSERSTSLVLPCISQESPASLATEYEEAAPSGYSTPLSSAPSEEVIDPAILPAGTGVDDRAMDRTVPNESYEAAPGILHESQGASQGSFSAVSSVTEKEKEAAAVKPKIDLIQTTTDRSLLYGDLQQERYDDARKYDTSLFLDKEENEFEVESLVAKGRIGRRVWYKVKWKGYPEADNSWVKKKDIGTGAIANYESRHPQGQGEFKFEKLVAKREWDGITLYEAKWHGQLESENIWVDKWDIGAKVVATFEIDLSRED